MKLFVLFCVFALVSNSIAFGVSDFEEKIDNLFEEEEADLCEDARNDQITKTLLGQGSYGKVYSFTSTTGEDCVVKVFIDGMENGFAREVDALNNLQLCRKAGVIYAKKVCPGDQSKKHMIVYPNLGSPLLPSHFEKESPCFILNVMTQITIALKCMQLHGLAHNDIKPANILMKNGVVHIIDLGNVVNARQKTFCGSTFEYMDPTAARAMCTRTTGTAFPYSKVDTYAFGMTMIYLLGGTLPFTLLPQNRRMEIVVQHKDYSNLDNWMQLTDQEIAEYNEAKAKGRWVDKEYYEANLKGTEAIKKFKALKPGIRKIILNMVSESIAIRPTSAVAEGFLLATRLYEGCYQ